MQALPFDDEVVMWTAQENNSKARRFREIILQVESQCKKISDRLTDSVWANAESKYRKTLYAIAYNTLISSPDELQANIEKAKKEIIDIQNALLEIVDPPVDSDLWKAFVFITNILITALTCGVANYIKEKKTGNCWFFTESKSAEDVRILNRKVIGAIEADEEDTHGNCLSF
jgi:hypothetical protein